MLRFKSCPFVTELRGNFPQQCPHIVVGITHSQTCLNLTGRLRALREAGFRVTLVCGPGELAERTAICQGVEWIELPMERGIAPLADVVSFVRLLRLLRGLKPDLVEFSTPKAGLLGTLAAMLCGVPRRIYMLRGLKLETCRGLKRLVLLAAEGVASACADVVLCNSASLRSEALALGIASAAKLQLLGAGSSNGVDVERFSPGTDELRHSFGIPLEAQVLGFVGRLTRDKGLAELIDAFELMLQSAPETHLLLVGWFDASEDALEDGLRRCIENHPRIHVTGFVEDTAPYYRAMDVMVLPTRREGFPSVVLEAAATGIPVITTDATGARDSVVPGVTGLLVSVGNPGALCEAAVGLLGDADRRREMGEAARAWVVEHYESRHVLGLTVAYYKSLLGHAPEMQASPSSIKALAADLE